MPSSRGTGVPLNIWPIRAPASAPPMVEIAPITDEAIPAMNLMAGEVTLLYFAKAQDEESAVIGKLARDHSEALK